MRIILSILFSLALLAPGHLSAEEAGQDDELFDTGCYNGIIADKYAIRLFLERNSGNLGGEYYYEKKGQSTKLKIRGTIDKGRVAVSEYDKKGTCTGKFNGVFDPDTNRVTGTWSKPDGTKNIPFTLWHVECRH